MPDAPERKEGEQRRRKHRRGERLTNTLKIGEEVLSHFQEMSLTSVLCFFFSFLVNLIKLHPEDITLIFKVSVINVPNWTHCSFPS